jgi:hypothetical protein
MIRRYLRAYGPATAEDFARWCWDGGGKNEARQLFESMEEARCGAACPGSFRAPAHDWGQVLMFEGETC